MINDVIRCKCRFLIKNFNKVFYHLNTYLNYINKNKMYIIDF